MVYSKPKGSKKRPAKGPKKKQDFNNNWSKNKKKKKKKSNWNPKPKSGASFKLDASQKPEGELHSIAGVFDPAPEGHGFLRNIKNCYAPAESDVIVPAFLVKENELRSGVWIDGKGDAEGSGSQNGKRVLWEIDTVDGVKPEEAKSFPLFSTLTSIDPLDRFVLEGDGKDLSMRALDFLTPIGKGQRGLIVSPPRAGKTILLQKVAQRIVADYPDVHLMVLLIDERPEEATHFKRSVDGEVIYSTSDEPPTKHIQVASS